MSLNDCAVVGSENVDPSMVMASVTISGVTLISGATKIPALQATWSATTNNYITGVEFQFGPADLSSGWTSSPARQDALSWGDTRVIAGRNYTVRFRATGADAVGPWSTPVTITVPSDFVSGSATSVAWGNVTSVPGALGVDADGKLASTNVRYSGGPAVVTLEALRPAEVGSNVTETRTAAAITSQSPWATYSTITPNSAFKPGGNLLYDAQVRLKGQNWTGINTGLTWGIGADVGPFLYANNTGTPATKIVQGPSMNILAGQAVTISVYGGTSLKVAGGAYVDIEWFNVSNVSLGYSSRVALGDNAVNGGYVRVSGVVTAPANTTYGKMRAFTESAYFSAGGFAIFYKFKIELGSTLTAWTDDLTNGAAYADGSLVDTLKPQEVGSNKTETRVAASVTGQGALATLSAVSMSGGQVTNKTANNMTYTAGGTVDSLRPGEVGANVTETRTANAIVGQGAWATASYSVAQVASPGANLQFDGGLRLKAQGWSLGTGYATGTGNDNGPYMSASVSNSYTTSQRWPCFANTTYTVQAWAATSAGSWTQPPQLYIAWYTSADAYISETAHTNIALGTGYAKHTATGTSPSNAAYGRIAVYSGISSGLASFWTKFKAEIGSVASVWSDENTYGALYQTGQNVDSLKPGEIGANVTETRTAASITGQGALATQNSVTEAQMQAAGIANAIIDPTFTKFASTWLERSAASGIAGRTDTISRDTWECSLTGTPASGLAFNLGQGLGGLLQISVGQRVEVSAYVGGGRCSSLSVGIIWYDGAKAFLTTSTVQTVTSFGDGANYDIANLTRIGGFVTAPSGARYCSLLVSAVTNGGASPNVRFKAPVLAPALSGQTTIRPYSSGFMGQLGADPTANNTAAAITGQGSLATQSTAGATQITVSTGENIIPDGDMRDLAWWRSSGTFPNSMNVVDAPTAFQFRRCIQIGNGGPTGAFDFTTSWFPMEPGQTYKITSRLWCNDTTTPWSGSLGSYIHVPAVMWMDLRDGHAADPSTNNAANRIVAPTDTVESVIYYTNPTGVAGNVNRQWQMRFVGSFTGNVAYVMVKIELAGRLGENVLRETGALLTDNAAVTSLGTAAAIAGQGALATASVTVAQVTNTNVPVGTNMLINSDWVTDLRGWDVGWDGNTGTTINRGRNWPDSNWYGARNNVGANSSGTPASGTVFDLYSSKGRTSFAECQRYAIPLSPGDRVFIGCMAAFHRASQVQFNMYFMDGAGAGVTEATVGAGGRNGGGGQGNPVNFDRIGGFYDVPAGSSIRWAVVYFRVICDGQANPYGFIIEPMACKVPAGQTAWPPYNAGFIDRLADQTSANTAAGFAGQGSMATQNSGSVTVTGGAISGVSLTLTGTSGGSTMELNNTRLRFVDSGGVEVIYIGM